MKTNDTDSGLGHDDSSRRLYRSEDSGPSSLENSEKKLKLNSETVDRVDRCTSPFSELTNMNELEIKLSKLEKQNNGLLVNVNELELKLSKLEKQNTELVEQNLELEEAENDSRLVSQKLKIKVDNLLEQIENLHLDLEQNQAYIKTSEGELDECRKRECKHIEQIKELQAKLDEETNISLSTIDSSEDWRVNSKPMSTLNRFLESSSLNESNNNPICNSIKPIKIDLSSKCNNDDSLSNQINNLNAQPNDEGELSLISQHSIDLHLKALENNQDELNDRLKHLQTVNKEFVKDLEQREHLLTNKELLFKEWITKENLLRRSIAELNNELDELNKQFNVSQRQRAELRAKCEELHHQLIELERNGTFNDDCGNELSFRQKELNELIVNCKQQVSCKQPDYDHRLVELMNKLMNKLQMQFDAQCNKEMEREEQTQVILDKYCQKDLELQEEMRHLLTKQNELKDQIYKQQKNLEKVSVCTRYNVPGTH